QRHRHGHARLILHIASLRRSRGGKHLAAGVAAQLLLGPSGGRDGRGTDDAHNHRRSALLAYSAFPALGTEIPISQGRMTDGDPPRAPIPAGGVATVTFFGPARRRRRLRLRSGSATDLVGRLGLATKEQLLGLVEV